MILRIPVIAVVPTIITITIAIIIVVIIIIVISSVTIITAVITITMRIADTSILISVVAIPNTVIFCESRSMNNFAKAIKNCDLRTSKTVNQVNVRFTSKPTTILCNIPDIITNKYEGITRGLFCCCSRRSKADNTIMNNGIIAYRFRLLQHGSIIGNRERMGILRRTARASRDTKMQKNTRLCKVIFFAILFKCRFKGFPSHKTLFNNDFAIMIPCHTSTIIVVCPTRMKSLKRRALNARRHSYCDTHC